MLENPQTPKLALGEINKTTPGRTTGCFLIQARLEKILFLLPTVYYSVGLTLLLEISRSIIWLITTEIHKNTIYAMSRRGSVKESGVTSNVKAKYHEAKESAPRPKIILRNCRSFPRIVSCSPLKEMRKSRGATIIFSIAPLTTNTRIAAILATNWGEE